MIVNSSFADDFQKYIYPQIFADSFNLKTN